VELVVTNLRFMDLTVCETFSR